jgi:hypothetical protein
METTAEGVETFDELDLARGLGCSHVQGFIYDQPLTAAEAGQRLEGGVTISADGPRSARQIRRTMLRRVILEHEGHGYEAKVRNMSATGALVEGLWNVPVGTRFTVRISEKLKVTATARWCDEDRMGIEFATPVDLGEAARGAAAALRSAETGEAVSIRKVG